MKKFFGWAALGVAPILSVGLSVLLWGRLAFNRLVRRDVAALLAHPVAGEEQIVTADMLKDLPEPVRRYLTYSGIVGKPFVRTVHLKQQGQMHLGPDLPWIPLDAEQYYAVQPPGFVWDGTMHLGPLPLARARDMYCDGAGHMLIKAGALIPFVDATGPEMDQASLMRYLSEMIWFPAAFLGANVSFAAVDDRSARVTLTDQGHSVSAMMYFDAEGRLIDFVAQRYRMAEAGYRYETWSAPVTEYGERAGLRLPVRGKAVWKLPEGDLEYIDLTITELAYNVAGPAARAAA
jgi:hypothetical protein